ncbi:hypothetical protein PRNP1_006874 [Phytophthora ramorum]
MHLLRRQFALVDAAFCFVAKHRAAPTVRSVLRVANSFGSAQLTRENLVELSTIAPDLLVLAHPNSTIQIRSDDVFSPTPLSVEDVEVVTFPLAPQTSQRASSKRKSLFDAALQKNDKLVEKQPKDAEISTEKSHTASVAQKTPNPTPKKQVQAHNDWGSSVLTMLQQMNLYRDQIVHVERRRSCEAQYRDLEALQLSPQVCEALEKCYSTKQLYSHQFDAIGAIGRGENVVLSTATASGKSLAYNVPMLDTLLQDPDATFMYLFPTKALSQDQLKSLRRFLEAADLPLHLGATFDGDTPMKSRSMVIRETRVFLTNPDMLHLTILPQHRQWKNVLSNLRMLVVDEAHMYRGVFGSHVARRIEQRLFSGDLLGVVATNALELGIDIGELDCTIHLGLPSSVASLWQQAGRAGRRQQQSKQKQSVAIIVCFDAPLDQHFAQKEHALELFQLEPEAVSLNPMNHCVLGQHLLCAARESALYSPQSGTAYIDSYVFGRLSESQHDGGHMSVEGGGQTVVSEVDEILQPLVKERKLMQCTEADGRINYRIHSCMPKKFRAVSLRSICDENYSVVIPSNNVNNDGVDGEVLDEIPGDRAFFQVYPTAVYLHQAQEYLITRLDNVQRIAFAKKCQQPLTYFTTCRDCTDLEVVRIHSTAHLERGSEKANCDSVLVCVGTVSILTRVFGSTMLEKRTMRALGTNEFSLPLMQSFGEAVWLEFPAAIRNQVEVRGGSSWTAALHGVGHLFVAVVRLFVLCDAEDVGTEHVNEFEQRVKPNRVTIFERREGGSGLVPEIVKVLPKVIEKAWAIASECSCSDGCPACIQSAGCSEFNHVLDKQGSLQILDFLHTVVGQSSSEG